MSDTRRNGANAEKWRQSQGHSFTLMVVFDPSSSRPYSSIENIPTTISSISWIRPAIVVRQEVLLDFPTNHRILQGVLLPEDVPDLDL